jgi:hypothetical protein
LHIWDTSIGSFAKRQFESSTDKVFEIISNSIRTQVWMDACLTTAEETNKHSRPHTDMETNWQQQYDSNNKQSFSSHPLPTI